MPFTLNNKFVESNTGKIIALRNYLVQKKITDEDLQRDETCQEILKGPLGRVTKIGPVAYNSLRNYIKDHGGVKKFLQLPVWRVCPPIAAATFNKKIQSAVPRESDFQQISVSQNRALLQELFDRKDIDEEMVKKYRALSKLIANADCEELIPKRHNKTDIIQFLRIYIREKSKQEEEGKKSESDEERVERHRPVVASVEKRKGTQEERNASNESKSDMAELNNVMEKLLSGHHVEFIEYALAVHSSFINTHANLQRWERRLRQQSRCSVDFDESTASSKPDKKSHRRSLPAHKH